jgi:negative regulator of flagellin synthesis FlgM
MVEVIKNTISRMEPRNTNNTNEVPRKAAKPASAVLSVDSVELKSAENMSVVKQMAASAPLDQVNVDRIKDAIKRGEYPIDIDRISEALLEAYKEMKN